MILQAFLATFRAIRSDRPALMLIVGSAILYSFFYPSAYSGEVATRVPIVIVDLDNSAASRSLMQKVTAVQQASVVAKLSSLPEAMSWILDRRAAAMLLVPAGFGDDILRGKQGQVALFGNGAYLLRSSTSLAGMAAALGRVGVEAGTSQAQAQGAPAAAPLAIIPRPLFNTREGYGSTVVPGVVFLIIHQTLLMGLAMLAATLRERQGNVKFSPSGFLGVALAFFVIGAAEVAYFAGFVFWFQDYPRAGADPLALLVAGSLFVAATVAGALALASFFRTRERPVQLWIVTSLPIFFLAGLSWPAEATPDWIVWLGRLLPTTPGIHVMVGLNQMGASMTEQAPELLNLAFLALLYGAVAFYRYTQRGEAPQRAIKVRPADSQLF